MLRGERERAVSLLEESQRLARASGDKILLESVLNEMAKVVMSDNPDLATAYLEEALRVAQKAGHLYTMVLLLGTLTGTHLRRDDCQQATLVSLEGLRLARQLQDHLLMAWLLQVVACALGRLGKTSRAAGLLGAADKALERLGVPSAADPLHSIHEVEALRGAMG